jgi:hypothetical protein
MFYRAAMRMQNTMFLHHRNVCSTAKIVVHEQTILKFVELSEKHTYTAF